VIQRLAARLARMDANEITWRGKAAARTLLHQASARLAAPRWNRAHLAAALDVPKDADGDLRAAYAALRRGAWLEAHRALARHFTVAPQPVGAPPRTSPTAIENERLAVAANADGTFEARFRFLLPGTYALTVQSPTGIGITTNLTLPVNVTLVAGETETQAVIIQTAVLVP